LTAEQIRRMREILSARPDMPDQFFRTELLCVLLEIAAQLAALNEWIQTRAIDIRNVGQR
jgi:hypothetical protein